MASENAIFLKPSRSRMTSLRGTSFVALTILLLLPLWLTFTHYSRLRDTFDGQWSHETDPRELEAVSAWVATHRHRARVRLRVPAAPFADDVAEGVMPVVHAPLPQWAPSHHEHFSEAWWLNQVAALVTVGIRHTPAFREASLRRLLGSLRERYPTVRVLVAADGADSARAGAALAALHNGSGAEFLITAPDSGVSAGRNAIIEAAQTPYLAYMDDDTEFWAETRLERLLECFPRAPDAALVAGAYAQPRNGAPADALETTPHARNSSAFRQALTRNVKSLWVGIAPGEGSAVIARPHRVSPPRSPLDDGAPGAGAPFTRRLPGRAPPAELLHCRRSGFTNLFFVARVAALRLSPFLPELKMEPEHEAFFLGWRAHGLRAVECAGVSILHHGWAHRGTPERDRYNAASLRKVKYPEALCKAYPCLKQLSSVHHSVDCERRRSCRGHRNDAARLWDVSRGCAPFAAWPPGPPSRVELLDATDPHAETGARLCAAASGARGDYADARFATPSRWLPLPPARDPASAADAARLAAEADEELQGARAAAGAVEGGSKGHRHRHRRGRGRRGGGGHSVPAVLGLEDVEGGDEGPLDPELEADEQRRRGFTEGPSADEEGEGAAGQDVVGGTTTPLVSPGFSSGAERRPAK